VETGKEYYQSEKMRLERGISSTPAVLDAQARFTQLEADYNNARFDYQLAMANLNFLMGTLVPVEFNQN
jgi:outer membrane protein TolC